MPRFLIKTIMMMAVIFILTALFYWQGINAPADKKGSDVNFTVAKGEGVKQIAVDLKKSGLINSEFYFEVYVWLKNYETKIQAGDYILNPSLSVKRIVKALAGGETVGNEMTIKIIEGWTAKEMGRYFENLGKFQEEKFLEAAGFPRTDYRNNKELPKLKDWSKEFGFLADKPAYYGLEGYLFPDTYRVFKDAGAEDIVEKMLFNFGEKLDSNLRAEIAKQGKAIYEIVTMASLLEKEVKTEEDMKIVSGIFWKRVKNGQPLESCATLAYILGVNKPQYSAEDTKIDSPHNTYRNYGLPPGPISNPGLKAIKAAIYPESTDYNYFLTDPKTGKTIFSKTFEEHKNNKNTYLR